MHFSKFYFSIRVANSNLKIVVRRIQCGFATFPTQQAIPSIRVPVANSDVTV